MDIQEELAAFCADLLSERQYLYVVQRVLAQEPGRWHELFVICSDLAETEQSLRLRATISGTLHVAWMPYSAGAYGDEYCTILFFEDDLLWSYTAIFNSAVIKRL